MQIAGEESSEESESGIAWSCPALGLRTLVIVPPAPACLFAPDPGKRSTSCLPMEPDRVEEHEKDTLS